MEVNGVSVAGLEPEQVIHILVKSSLCILFVAQWKVWVLKRDGPLCPATGLLMARQPADLPPFPKVLALAGKTPSQGAPQDNKTPVGPLLPGILHCKRKEEHTYFPNAFM